MKKFRPILVAALAGLMVLCSALASCDLYTYGALGGADRTGTFLPGSPPFESVMASLSGVWYSRYAGAGRLDGYRIGRWADCAAVAGAKAALFPHREDKTYTAESGSDVPAPGDYFVLYDDTGGGRTDTGGTFVYWGIVRAVNVFNGDRRRGAVIIEYLKGCAPRWHGDLRDGRRPFFGLYYRALDGAVQMANAVDLAALYRGETYYTETAHLAEAVAKNSAENEAEFVSWGVVIPQEREP
jgi:hypothetical protein